MKKYLLKIIIGFVILGSTAMATEEWILGQPVQTDTTNYEWSLGSPYVVTTSVGGEWIGISGAHYDSHSGDGGSNTLVEALGGTDYWDTGIIETPPHWFILDLGQIYNIQKIRGRSLRGYDPINIDVYINDTGEAPWGNAVVSEINTWQDTDEWQEVDTTDKNGQYVLVQIIESELEGNRLQFGGFSPSFTIFDVFVEGEIAAEFVPTPYYYRAMLFIPIIPLGFYYLRRRKCAA